MWIEHKNPAYGRQSISRPMRIVAPIQKETPKKSCVKSWISSIQYFSNFNQSMWWFYLTSMWQIYWTSIWQLYSTSMRQLFLEIMWRLITAGYIQVCGGYIQRKKTHNLSIFNQFCAKIENSETNVLL